MPLIVLGILIGFFDLLISSAILFPLTLSLIFTGVFNICFSPPIYLSLIVFTVLLIALYILAFILIKKSRFFNKNNRASNNDSVIGSKCTVLSVVDSEVYLVKVNSEQWTALSFDGGKLEVGDICIVQSIEGVRLTIKKENI